ncbi:pre-mRNA-splicing factor CWC22 homolog [Hyalella azteca]|uniref:Pre-mRNA-splicing factor CWC22 homolog n=1 Tax=Hyalella azteca TaxID=294128 RepID=A0A8B7PCE0_HYAAZ|nr:pre-mRNA-splicing factor CWC22 homolog [Hyalella azteca]
MENDLELQLFCSSQMPKQLKEKKEKLHKSHRKKKKKKKSKSKADEKCPNNDSKSLSDAKRKKKKKRSSSSPSSSSSGSEDERRTNKHPDVKLKKRKHEVMSADSKRHDSDGRVSSYNGRSDHDRRRIDDRHDRRDDDHHDRRRDHVDVDNRSDDRRRKHPEYR